MKHLNEAGWIQPYMISADMTAKLGLETASQLPAHHCHDHNISLAEQSLQQEPTHQTFATPNPDTFTMHHPTNGYPPQSPT